MSYSKETIQRQSLKNCSYVINNNSLVKEHIDNCVGVSPGSLEISAGASLADTVRLGFSEFEGGAGSTDSNESLDGLPQRGDTCLKFLTINVCGIKSKLKFPDFCYYIQEYDFIGINETKLDEFDTLEIEGYNIFCLNRNNKKAVRSGGVALLVKSNLCKYVQILHGSSLDIYGFI